MSLLPRTGVCMSCGHDHGNGLGLPSFAPTFYPAAPLPAAPAPSDQERYQAAIKASDERMKDPLQRVLAEQAGELPRVIGISRDAESPGGKTVLMALDRAPTDDELRGLHIALAARQAPTDLVATQQKPAAPMWISVDFMLPEPDVEVLIDGSEGVEVARYSEGEEDQTDQMGHDAGWWGYKFAACGRSFGNPQYIREAQGQPKYWMHLPDVPEECDECAGTGKCGPDDNPSEMDCEVCKGSGTAAQQVSTPDAGVALAQSPVTAEGLTDGNDAARFRQAIALDDNAEALYAAVLNNSPDVIAIRSEFDAAIAAADKGTTP